jgi:hypothetical protein
MIGALATIMAALIAGAVSLITGGVITYVLAREKTLSDFRANFETALRLERRKDYRKLWRLTGLLPLYARTTPISFTRLAEFAIELRQWYFDAGGIVLSEASRDSYFALQEAIAAAVSERPGEASGPIAEELYSALRAQCSQLRTALCNDLGSRTPPLIGQGRSV